MIEDEREGAIAALHRLYSGRHDPTSKEQEDDWDTVKRYFTSQDDSVPENEPSDP